MIQTNDIIMRQDATANVGRVGGFFTFQDNPNNVYGISNNHVIANLNNCQIGDIICDASNNPIGKLSTWIELQSGKNLSNDSEFALFKLDDPTQVQWLSLGSNPKPSVFAVPTVDMHVSYPNNIGTSYGIIAEVNCSIPLVINGQNYSFTNCLKITPSGSNMFSDHGDSGGLVYSTNNQLVGIILGIIKSTPNLPVVTIVVPFNGSIFNYVNFTIY